MNIYSLLFLLVTSISLSSCNHDLNDGVTGWWTIDTIYYKKQEIRFCLLSNSIYFKTNSCVLPTTSNMCDGLNISSSDGTWSVSQKAPKSISLKIVTPNKIFSGDHYISFVGNDEKKLLKMTIQSDELYIICTKGLYNYDSHKDLTRKLEEKNGNTNKSQ